MSTLAAEKTSLRIRCFTTLAFVALVTSVSWTYWAQSWPTIAPSQPRGVAHASPTAHLDGVYYYAFLRSILLDGDLDFANDYEKLGNPLNTKPIPATGKTGNVFTIGPALFWSPFFGIARVLAAFSSAWGPPDGTGARFQQFVFFGSCLYGLASCLLSYLIARVAYLRRDALVASIVATLATPLFWHMTRQASYSHAISAFLSALLVWLWIGSYASPAPHRWFALGAIAGIGTCVRIGAVAHVLVPAAELLPALCLALARKDAAATRAHVVAGVVFGAGLVLGFSPQMFAWKVLYGTLLTVPQGSSFMFWSGSRFGAVVFSTWNGWAAWHPMVSFGIIGLFVASVRSTLPARMRRLAGASLLVIAAQAYLNGATDDWFAGWAFGGRRFTDCSVYIAIGVAQLFALLGERALHENISRFLRVAIPAVASLVFTYFSFALADQHLNLTLPIWGPINFGNAWRVAVVAGLDRVYALTGNWGSIPVNWWYASSGNVSPGNFDSADARSDPLVPPNAPWRFIDPSVSLGGFGDRGSCWSRECRWLSAANARFAFLARTPTLLHAELSVGSHVPGAHVRLSIDGQTLLERNVEPGGLRSFQFDVPEHLVRVGYNFVRVDQQFPARAASPVGTTGRSLSHDVVVNTAGWSEAKPGTGELFVDGRLTRGGPRGVSLFTVSRDGSVRLLGSFDTSREPSAVDEFAAVVASVADGTVVALATAEQASTLFSERGDLAIRALGGSRSLAGATHASYAMLGAKGAPSGTAMETFSAMGPSQVVLGQPRVRGTLWHQLVLSSAPLAP